MCQTHVPPPRNPVVSDRSPQEIAGEEAIAAYKEWRRRMMLEKDTQEGVTTGMR